MQRPRTHIIAAVVTYHPEPGEIARIRDLTRQFDRVIVVDNHSQPASRQALRSLADSDEALEVIENDENRGIATALNQACRRALEHDSKWIVTFDQDSVPTEDFVARLQSEWEADSNRDRIGLIGVNYRNATGATLVSEGPGLAEARTVITSGSLLNLAAWQQMGPFRDDFFIDEVDHEYSLRIRRGGWVVKLMREVLMDHAVGSMRRHRFFGWRPTLSHHPPLRRYYMIRNRVFLAREHFRSDPDFIRNRMLAIVYDFTTVVLFEADKIRKLVAMIKGLFDGLRGRTGSVA